LRLLRLDLKDTLTTTLIALISIGVSIIKGASYLDIVGRLGGFSTFTLVASSSRCNIITRSELITTLGSNGKSLVFSYNLLILYLVKA
jgi:hypothetical protein